MDEKTVRALNAINRSFYGERAATFSATRRDPWPGWTRLLPFLRERGAGGPFRVLDVGCGNGRFGAYLADALPAAESRLHYHGLDASESLLATVRDRELPCASFETTLADVVETGVATALGARSFDFIAVFGLLHHIPGEALRSGLLASLVAHLEPGGLLALAVWRFEQFERFRARLLPWAGYGAGSEQAIDTGELEAGDHLLPWGETGDAVRYCHYADDAEVARWLSPLPVETIACYDADGREGSLNRYFVLRMREGE